MNAREYIDDLCARHGWTLADLAREAGYGLETLQKARRGHPEVPLSDRMRSALQRASRLAVERGGRIAEDEAIYHVGRYEPGAGGDVPRVVPLPCGGEAALIEEAIDLLRDVRVASMHGRRNLLTRLGEIVTTLRGAPAGGEQPKKTKGE